MRRLAAVLCLVLIASACGGDDTSSETTTTAVSGDETTATEAPEEETETTEAPEEETTTTAIDDNVKVNIPEREVWPNDLCYDFSFTDEEGVTYEGRYTKGQIVEFYEVAIDLVKDFVNDCMVDNGLSEEVTPEKWWYVGSGDEVESECFKIVDGERVYTDTDMSYNYCRADDSITVGLEALWFFYDKGGDAAALIGLMHEFGHAIQATTETPTPETFRVYEMQADCIAGSMIEWLRWTEVLEAVDDFEDVNRLIGFIAGEPTDPDRSHGSEQERASAMQAGINGGPLACNQFSPDNPIFEW